MAPKYSTHIKNEKWYLTGFSEDTHKVQYELEFNGDIIRPGDQIKIKHLRGTFRFRCFVHCYETGTAWFDCVADDGHGPWHSFDLNKLKGKVKAKRSYRKRNGTK